MASKPLSVVVPGSQAFDYTCLDKKMTEKTLWGFYICAIIARNNTDYAFIQFAGIHRIHHAKNGTSTGKFPSHLGPGQGRWSLCLLRQIGSTSGKNACMPCLHGRHSFENRPFYPAAQWMRSAELLQRVQPVDMCRWHGKLSCHCRTLESYDFDDCSTPRLPGLEQHHLITSRSGHFWAPGHQGIPHGSWTRCGEIWCIAGPAQVPGTWPSWRGAVTQRCGLPGGAS